ncbi:putative transcription factor bHLH family [Helianthus annuus]|nr:putative transcription factor bHLH family [Helianthus annuus]
MTTRMKMKNMKTTRLAQHERMEMTRMIHLILALRDEETSGSGHVVSWVKGSSGKREKMKKMVKSLRGIVPGGNAEMNTVDVLDEAVKYLKSLKVEAHKMGFGNLPGEI